MCVIVRECALGQAKEPMSIKDKEERTKAGFSYTQNAQSDFLLDHTDENDMSKLQLYQQTLASIQSG